MAYLPRMSACVPVRSACYVRLCSRISPQSEADLIKQHMSQTDVSSEGMIKSDAVRNMSSDEPPFLTDLVYFLRRQRSTEFLDPLQPMAQEHEHCQYCQYDVLSALTESSSASSSLESSPFGGAPALP